MLHLSANRELFLYALALHPLKENGEFVCVTYIGLAHKLLVHVERKTAVVQVGGTKHAIGKTKPAICVSKMCLRNCMYAQ
jgi:hypothetical protein